jgi:hypothetical protein
MSGHDSLTSDGHLPIAQLPATAMQALYHAVTGKTENLTKRLTKNVIIRRDDLDRLMAMLRQQMQHYVITSGPTITVKLIYANKQSQQFSSWERFAIQDASTMEITSEITIKHEFLLQLPDTSAPQRCVININIDSKLPIYMDEADDFFEFPMWIITNIPTVVVSIDFVDYLIAKVFCQIVDDWFGTIPSMKTNPWLARLIKSSIDWSFLFDRIGLVGLAAFMSSYVLQRGGNISNIGQLVYLLSAGIILVSVSTVFTKWLGRRFTRRLHMSSIPSMVVLTKGDEIKSIKIMEEAGKSLKSMTLYSGAAFTAVILNVVASYLYSWLTR